MHDTGRAENARHHEDASAVLSGRVCTRLQIKGTRRRLLLFLVDHHLTFWKTATTKNLEDPNTIAEFASIVRSAETLKYLYLLSYADASGTSSESWNGWKASLMRHLYNLTLAYFVDQDAFRRRLELPDANLREEVTRQLAPSFAGEIDVHFRLMPERYFRTRSADTIATHLKVFRTFFENLATEGDDGPGARGALGSPARGRLLEGDHRLLEPPDAARPPQRLLLRPGAQHPRRRHLHPRRRSRPRRLPRLHHQLGAHHQPERPQEFLRRSRPRFSPPPITTSPPSSAREPAAAAPTTRACRNSPCASSSPTTSTRAPP